MLLHPFIPESPQPHHCQGSGVSDASFSDKMKFLCSFGGRILPRPNDGKLRYVGGETKIISIRKNLSWVELVKKTSAICNQLHTIKYQLPGEDLDALISVSSDEDLHHMIEEYHELERIEGSQRLRIFLVPVGEPESPSSFETRATQQNEADYQYVVAVNGMLDPSPRKNSSGQSVSSQTGNTCDYRDPPTFFHPLEMKDGASSSNLVGMFTNPAAQFLTSLQTPTKSFQQSPPVSPLPVQIEILRILQCISSRIMHTMMVMKAPVKPPSRDFVFSPVHGQSEVDFERPVLKERAFHSHPKDPLGLLSGSTNDLVGSHHRMLHVLSDSQLRGHEGRPDYHLEEGITPLMVFSTQEISNEKYQEAYQNQPTLIVDDHKGNNGLGQDTWNWEDEIDTQVGQERNMINTQYSYFPLEFQDHGDTTMNSASTLMIPENSADIVREQPHDYSLGASTPKFLVKSQNATKDMQHAMTEVTKKQQSPSSASLTPSAGNKSGPSLNLQKNYPLSTESSFENPDKNAVMSGVSTLKDEDPLNFPYHEVEGPEGHFYERLNPGDAIFVQSQPSDNHHNGNTPVEDEASDVITSSGEAEAESDIQESEGEEGRDLGESISDAAMAEMEASIYGLQMIKNADLEELKELGSGTFGTVYHGKWRGTDVAIKRIKKSCFAGRSSEQERLTKDFWREARILSNLHHPNVVAFYGVVPDGPGGTLATVTEYMVNGSLRHVLLRKDRSLDRRKRLIIAMDAAFGMEYLHLKNIVHFDLKCDNLLVNMRDTQRPICKLEMHFIKRLPFQVGDFGLSRIKRNTLVSGGVRGTLPWMAPELLNGSSNRVSEKVDVFSFGVAMWEILTGEEPYANMHCGAIIGGIVSNTLRPPIPERCDPDWRKLMEECWSPDPAARPSFTEITNRLRVMSMAIQTKRHNQANR
ncbi:Serine/threonine-protein kinase EDR1 [Vitis vinifera]|uniref:Serine/threonine-protein kinase EDR1 n=1 Tax=Vitis vinifera TaxID=29760 RepID=A0A438CME8_VITVI|nr:Serine/threonine-protein kinase EDR1 [Vitis vinifera]